MEADYETNSAILPMQSGTLHFWTTSISREPVLKKEEKDVFIYYRNSINITFVLKIYKERLEMLPSTGQELGKCTDASGNQIQAEGKILPCCSERNWCSYVWEFTQILIQ